MHRLFMLKWVLLLKLSQLIFNINRFFVKTTLNMLNMLLSYEDNFINTNN